MLPTLAVARRRAKMRTWAGDVHLLPGQKESREVSVNGDRRNDEDIPLAQSKRRVVVENTNLGGDSRCARTDPRAHKSTDRWGIVNRAPVDGITCIARIPL